MGERYTKQVLGLLFLFTANGLGQTMALPFHRAAHAMILDSVYLNGCGPFQMLVDTGNAASVVTPATAKRLSLRSVYAVEHITMAGTNLAPVAILGEVKVGSAIDRQVEVMIADVRLDRVDGTLGQSWLSKHDYLIDYKGKRLLLDCPCPATGIRLPLHSVDQLPAVVVGIDGKQQHMILDSGTPMVMLFRACPRGAAILVTNVGSTAAEFGSTRLLVGERQKRMDAARVSTTQILTDLLPTHIFRSVFVGNSQRIAVLQP